MANLRTFVLVTVVLALLIRILSIGIRGRRCPPGPPTLPVIGNLHQLPKKDMHLQYQRWSKKYGPIFHLKLGSQDVVVLASGEMIKKLVDKRSGNYADRPALYMQDVWQQSRIIMRGYDDLWKVERRVYHQFLSVTKSHRYTPYQDLETKQLCFDLLNEPERWENLITRTTLSAATSMAYGFRVTDTEDPVLKELMKNTHGFFTMVHSSKLLDWYPELRPIVKWLPSFIYPLARRARQIYIREKAQFHELYNDARKGADVEGSLPSFAKDIMKSQESWKGTQDGNLLTDHAASYIAGIAMEGAADTQSNTLAFFLKAMILYPDIQRQAQKHLDAVVGNGRMPQPEDRENLPYIRQIMKETLRWQPTAIAGAIPHRSRAEDEIDGYRIPAGSTIVLAVWTANRDPSLFPNPDEFDPSRQNPGLTLGEAALASDIKDRDHWTFGAGRRLCPGIHVAERTLFLAMARILWAFTISKAKDASGNEIEIIQDEVTQSIAARPLPFKCSVIPRSAKHAQIVKESWKKAQELLDDDGNYKQNVL